MPLRLGCVLAGLYAAQGLVVGFICSTFPTVLRQEGVSLWLVGLSSLAMLPWALNVFWAPLVDRFALWNRPHRKSWIVPLQLTLPPLFVLLGFQLGAGHVYIALVLLMLAGFAASTSDVAAHGLAVDRLKPSERGTGNALQVGGYWVGSLVSSGIILILVPTLGVEGAVGLFALIVGLTVVPVFFFPEKGRVAPPSRVTPGVMVFLRRPDALAIIALIFLFHLGRSASMTMESPFLVDMGLRSESIGLLRGVFGVCAGFGGSLLGALLLHRMDRYRALIAVMILQALSTLVWWGVAAAGVHDFWILAAAFVFQYLVTSMAIVVILSLMMDRCCSAQAATDFTVQYCIGNLVQMLGGAVSGFSAETLGYSTHFGLCFVLCLVGVAAAPSLYRRIQRHPVPGPLFPAASPLASGGTP
ncbi:MFS transporter [Phaeovibrio sulfidiphilus]|uniref:MFS transporter n=1 Tax=Phaeovibrio sulfidiphilus TaxID=1220600 RepID=A0A8J6YPH5_9PROT|nr:MFS transporter [Phaeovibrio sulfidiphilus]MBE1237226.1 MFS transporter [Phaeovibrio sulfidiphilus]